MYVEVSSFTKKIKGITVLDNITCSFEKGRIYGLQGKNGSGKTMLLRAIAGLIFPTAGSVCVEGKTLGKEISFPTSMGLLIESPSFINKYTGMKNLRLLAQLRGSIGDKEIADSLNKVGLDPQDKRIYKKYSLGMKQRLAIACAIMEDPDLILLDEPINALDPSGIELVRSILIEKKMAGSLILVACHDYEELSILADEIITLSEGRIVNHEAMAS
jgi:ABC-2 type transport system ATP-binding protein